MIRWRPIFLGVEPKVAVAQERIWDGFQQGLFKIPEAMVEEIRLQLPWLSDEIEKREVEIIIPNQAIMDEVNATRERFKAEGRIVGRKCVSKNDVQLMLIAKDLGMTVVTEEKPREVRFNLPAACDHLGVPWMSSLRMRGKLGF